jgi:hypothetical protein
MPHLRVYSAGHHANPVTLQQKWQLWFVSSHCSETLCECSSVLSLNDNSE